MSLLPNLEFKGSVVYSGVRNSKGQLCNVYQPLQNLADKDSKKLGDFTTDNLNFDMEHPVDIILQDSYDGAVNMIINDGKNKSRLINSRFSVQNDGTFKIPDHSGFKDTNIYDEETFDVDTQLKAVPINIPHVEYNGLINNAGKLQCGSYTFYFKLADADGNETEVIAESGIVQCHIGTVNSPGTIRMGLQDENSSKAIKFTLSNIDAGFDYIHVLFSKSSSGNDLAVATVYNKIIFDYPIDKNGICEITITGAETIIGVSKEECNVDYADINSVQTQAVNNNVLLFGNVDTPEHNWDEIKRFTWKIIPRYKQLKAGDIGSLNQNYEDSSIDKSLISDHGYCYYNTKNIYYRLGYWPDEIYRFGIVYIFNDNSLSPVINLQGIDFSKVNIDDDFAKLFFQNDPATGETKDYLFEEDGLYFNKEYRTNSRGVIKFPKLQVKTVKEGALIPKPLYINFDLSYIGRTDYNKDNGITYKDVFKKHNIKGFFFVRQKRVPTILGEGLVIGLTHKECGALPVIKSKSTSFTIQPFLTTERLLDIQARDLEIDANTLIKTGLNNTERLFKNQALLCPDAEMDEATYNQLFVSNKYCLENIGYNTFKYNKDSFTSNVDFYQFDAANNKYISKLTNVPEDTKTLTNGTDYFSTIAGNPDEPYKTVDVLNVWKWTKPQDLTVSTSLVRGKWGPFVGISNPYENTSESDYCPFEYGQTYIIKKDIYENEEQATELDFWSLMNSNSHFFAISDRTEAVKSQDCFRGDCYISLFTHRMFRNFIDPELPTNNKIVDPACWQKNYGVRCTAQLLQGAHSNLTSDSAGWYIGPTDSKKDKWVQAAIYFLTGNLIGFIIQLAKKTSPEDIGIDVDESTGEPVYTNGYANEIVQAFEVYIGGHSISSSDALQSIAKKFKQDSGYYDSSNTWYEPSKKKVNPKEQEASGGFSLKSIFKSDDDWDLRGLSGINRADVNAVQTGQWITFPVCSNKNLAMRDIDFSNATEEAAFNKKRSFYPLAAKDRGTPLRDSNVINGATGISLPKKPYMQLPKVPYFKQEYFTRIQNSLRDSSSSVTNEFKVMLESSYHDYTKVYGSITKLESKGDYVFIIFKHGIGILNMSASIAQAQDATKFLPEVSIISDTYGSIWKDSIIQTPYGIYGIDSVAKVIWKIEGTSVKVISDMKVEKFLIDNLDMSEFNLIPYIGHINIKSHYNAFKHDVMFTYYNDLLYVLPEQYPSSKGYSVDLDGNIIDESGKKYIVDEETGNPIFYGKAERILPKYDDETQTWQSYSDLLIEYDNGQIKLKDYQWVNGTNWSLCWNEDLQAFQTFYDWIPVESENIDNIYFSFNREDIDKISKSTNQILVPQFVYSKQYYNNKIETKLDLTLGTTQSKYWIDPQFTNEIKVYTIKPSYYSLNQPPNINLQTRLDSESEFTLERSKCAAFTMYIKTGGALRVTINGSSNSGGKVQWSEVISESNTNEWVFFGIGIKNFLQGDILINNVYISPLNQQEKVEYQFFEPKLVHYDKVITNKQESYICKQSYINNSQILGFSDYYDLRNSENSIKLWKHGQAGVYDNQGKIKPTNWYGKQHEFNFEFVVNENSSIQKIFNNLKIISNKAEPYKFEYEVVGEAYEWYEYKEIIHWINQKVKDNVFTDLDTAYKYVLGNTLEVIKQTYKDFPELFNKEDSYKIPKLPYLEIKLSDKKGIPDKDKSYTTHTTKVDNWSEVDKTVGNNDYKLNTTETIIVEDEQLNEYRIHTEQYGNNMKKFGRVRGNMEYLEDLWDIEIRPISFRWTYLDEENNLLKSKLVEARLRDKYIKIKIRYTGEDLVIIQAISTMFDYSFA